MTAPGERGPTARKYSDGSREAEPTLQEHVAALIKENAGRAELIDALAARAAASGVEIVMLKGRVAALEEGTNVPPSKGSNVPSAQPDALPAAPSPVGLPVDPNMPSQAERDAMVKRLQDRTNAAAAKNAETHRQLAADRDGPNVK